MLETKDKGTNTLVSSFLCSYRRTTGNQIVTGKSAAKLALLVGSSLNYFVPRNFWYSTKDEVQFWKDRAMQLIRAGLEEDLTQIASSEVGFLWQE